VKVKSVSGSSVVVVLKIDDIDVTASKGDLASKITGSSAFPNLGNAEPSVTLGRPGGRRHCDPFISRFS